ERWMDWLLASLNTPYVRVFVDSRNPPEKRPASFAEHAKSLADEMSLLEGHVSKRQWLALGRLTLADIALVPSVNRCLEFPIERSKTPGVERWMGEIDKRSACQVAIGNKPPAKT